MSLRPSTVARRCDCTRGHGCAARVWSTEQVWEAVRIAATLTGVAQATARRRDLLTDRFDAAAARERAPPPLCVRLCCSAACGVGNPDLEPL